jgi:hypothetical protein
MAPETHLMKKKDDEEPSSLSSWPYALQLWKKMVTMTT